MKITVNRIVSDWSATLSTVSIDGKFACFGIEDVYRDEKIPNKTRIPSGTYDIGVRTFGGFHGRYTNRFPFHKGMLEVMNVPNFEHILIHIGNSADDTAGCLLLGQNAFTNNMIYNSASKVAYTEFYQNVIDEALNGNLQIEYIDNDL